MEIFGAPIKRLTLIYILGLVSSSTFAQWEIGGHCIFKPPIDVASIKVHLVVGNDTILSVPAENEKDFYFRFRGANSIQQPIIRVQIEEAFLNSDLKTNHADEYISVGNGKWKRNPHDIKIVRKKDLYATYFQSANNAFQANDIDKAYNALSYISNNKEALDLNKNQLFETYLGLGATAKYQRRYTLQLAFIDSLSYYIDLDRLNRIQIDRYAKEKFNALLSSSSYNSMNYPVHDFADRIVSDSVKFREWGKFVNEIGKYYSVGKVCENEEILKDQIELLDRLLNHQ